MSAGDAPKTGLAGGGIVFREVADGVLVATTSPLDVNVTLIVGAERALLVDTLSTAAQARSLLASVRERTAKPLSVVNTHFHFDHCFGNSVFAEAGCPIWAHERAAAELAEHGRRWQRRWHEQWREREPELAAGLAEARIKAPDHLVRDSHVINLGGRVATLAHFGHGHTDGDLTVLVGKAGSDHVDAAIVGDLVEESGPPDFEDAHPLEWPATLARLVTRLTASTVVTPGHGAVVDVNFTRAQHADLSAFEWLIRDAHRDGAPASRAAARGPFPAEAGLVGVERGFATLDAH